MPVTVPGLLAGPHRADPAPRIVPAGGGSVLVTFEPLLSASAALGRIAEDLQSFGAMVDSWQRPVGTDDVMGSGNADRSWRHLAEYWGRELGFYGSEARDLADALRRAAAQYSHVETEVSARCRG